jgi:dissimilatory sulfite reductase (desulfoviridin) alpha/beta subunit
MKWSREAEEAVSRVPFFVRKRVKKKVEEETLREGAREVGLAHVHACRKRFLENMESEVKGYQVETCFGPDGCPNRAVETEGMARRIEEMVAGKRLPAFLKERVKGPLKMHHEFRICISDCPNACSRPQIVDVGLIGARRPAVSEEACTQCGSCVEVCREGAILLPDSGSADGPVIDFDKCLSCGQCLAVCPSGALRESERGYRVLVGGKLGRHPQLGRELGRIRSAEEALATIERCLGHYMKHNRCGERFGEIVNETGGEGL